MMTKIKILFLFLAIVLASKATAQNQRKIVMYKTFGGVVYMLNDSAQLSSRQTASVLYEKNQHAYSEFKKARNWSTCSAITGFAGAAMIAIPVATLAFGEKSDWGFAGGGALLIVGSIFLNREFKARALYSIDLYNQGLSEKTSRVKPELQFYGTGARLVIKF